MTLLLNLLLPVIYLVIGYITYTFYKKSQDKKITLVKGAAAILLSYTVYATVQPSYIPKTEVKPLPKVTEEVVKELTVQDRLLKPATKEQSKANVESLLTAKDSINKILEDSKTKENNQ